MKWKEKLYIYYVKLASVLNTGILNKNVKAENPHFYFKMAKIASEMLVPHSLGKHFQHHEI